MLHTLRAVTFGRRATRLVLLGALIALAGAGASAAHAATVTKTSFAAGIPGFPTQAGGLGVFEAGTPVLPADAIREVGTYAVTVVADPAIPAEAPFAGSFKAYAVTDIRNHTDNGVAYTMALQLAPGFAGEFPGDVPAKLTWLLRHADALIAGEADTARAAAAVQIVVWQTLPLTRADLVKPSVDDAVNALAVKFTSLMDAGFNGEEPDGATPVLSAGPVSGCASTITITGTPGHAVTLTVDNGGVLSTSVVVIGQDGTATAMVQGTPGATVTVTGSIANGGELVRADGVHAVDVHTTEANQSFAPEELIFLGGQQITSSTVLVACPALVPPLPPAPLPVPPLPPAPLPVPLAIPPVTVAGVTGGALALTKTGPSAAIAGQVITYRLRVRNSSSVPVTSVVLRDVLPAGMTLVSRPAGTTIKNGTVVWQLGTLAPGQRRSISLQVRINRAITGRRCNSANASAANAATVRVRACSAIRAVSGAVRIPIVTG